LKQIVVLSGKGGTGKTTVAAALGHLASGELTLALVDADVDASNLELLLGPAVRERHPFIGGEVAEVDPDRCEGCGLCAETCRFGAISLGPVCRIDAIACEGCRACSHACPTGAIRMRPDPTGSWFASDTDYGPLFHAELHPGRENSGKLVTVVRRAAAAWAHENGGDLVLVDGPPGIGCPAIAASNGTDLALLVAEPSVAGIHDLLRMLDTVDHFGIPAFLCINKHDLSPSKAEEIVEIGARRGVEVVARIPFDSSVSEALAACLPVTRQGNGPVRSELERLWDRLRVCLSVDGDPEPGGDRAGLS
jgi:MinD superfamily P-loop ATPase